jgi:hypothetical protein
MKQSKNKADIKKIVEKMADDKGFIVKMVREGKKNELKGKFKFANPL